MKRLCVYIDTSVIGGCLDDEFNEDSRLLLQKARSGEIELQLSALLMEELSRAPPVVHALLREMVGDRAKVVSLSAEADRLKDAYLSHGVVGPSAANDALHVALATVNGADVVVSWNFKHLVHLEKVRGFNAVNMMQGYPPIEVRSPRELV